MDDNGLRTTTDAARLARVSVRQLGYWADNGYVNPRRESGPGYAGQQLRWSPADIDLAEYLGVLSRTVNARNFLEIAAGVLAKDGPVIVLTDRQYDVTVTLTVHDA